MFFKNDYVVRVKAQNGDTGNLYVSAYSHNGACSEIKSACRISGYPLNILKVEKL